MKSLVKMPSYMQAFKCIAAECEETCCAGWYIAIDEATLKKYKKVKEPEMKKRLDKELVIKKGTSVAKIKLKNNRCAFLDKQNLCDIYSRLGENYLSETCKMYPRNTNQIGEQVELSLALSCPEAARLILLHQGPIGFTEETYEALPIVGAHMKLNLGTPKHFEDYLLSIRELLIEILQDDSISFKEKWSCLQAIMTKLDRFKQRQEHKKLDEYLETMKNKGYLKIRGAKLEDAELLTSKGGKRLIGILQGMRETKKWPSARYEACYEKAADCFGTEFNEGKYKAGEKVFETFVLKEHAYILENYFVNYIYERLIPLDQKSPLESFKMMNLYLALIKLHLIGLISNVGAIELKEIVTCIQSFTRVFDHNELYIEQIKKQLAAG